VFNFVSVCKVRKINVKYDIFVCAKRGDQNSAIVRVCFIRVYVFTFAATFDSFFSFFLLNQTFFKDEFLLTNLFENNRDILGSKVLAETPCILLLCTIT
jgi:hypothetical protein